MSESLWDGTLGCEMQSLSCEIEQNMFANFYVSHILHFGVDKSRYPTSSQVWCNNCNHFNEHDEMFLFVGTCYNPRWHVLEEFVQTLTIVGSGDK